MLQAVHVFFLPQKCGSSAVLTVLVVVNSSTTRGQCRRACTIWEQRWQISRRETATQTAFFLWVGAEKGWSSLKRCKSCTTCTKDANLIQASDNCLYTVRTTRTCPERLLRRSTHGCTASSLLGSVGCIYKSVSKGRKFCQGSMGCFSIRFMTAPKVKCLAFKLCWISFFVLQHRWLLHVHCWLLHVQAMSWVMTFYPFCLQGRIRPSLLKA